MADDLEVMCCMVQGTTAEELEKAALKVKSMPAHTQARWLWRLLVKEATASLSAINDEVYATLSNLEEVAVAAGVAAPPAALMLQVRTECTVRHLRAGSEFGELRYSKALERFFPEEEEGVPSGRAERARRTLLFDVLDPDSTKATEAKQRVLVSHTLDTALDLLSDYLDVLHLQLGPPKETTDEQGGAAVGEEEDEEVLPATQAPEAAKKKPKRAAVPAPPAQAPAPAAAPSPAPAPPAAAAAAAAAARDESGVAQQQWPFVSLQSLQRAYPRHDFEALREAALTPQASQAAAAKRKRQAAAAAAEEAAEEEEEEAPVKLEVAPQPQQAPAAPAQPPAGSPRLTRGAAGRGRGARTKSAAKPPRRRQQVSLVDTEDEDQQEEKEAPAAAPAVKARKAPPAPARSPSPTPPPAATFGDADEDGDATQPEPPQAATQPPPSRSPIAAVGRIIAAVGSAVGAALGVGVTGRLASLAGASAQLKATGKDPLAGALQEARLAGGGSPGKARAAMAPGEQSPPGLRIHVASRGATARTVAWSSGGVSDDAYDVPDPEESDEEPDAPPRKKGRTQLPNLTPAARLSPVARGVPASPASPGARRQPQRWGDAEEELLIRLHGEIGPATRMWAKILRAGGAGFMDGRSSVDLKDKWRNLQKAKRV